MRKQLKTSCYIFHLVQLQYQDFFFPRCPQIHGPAVNLEVSVAVLYGDLQMDRWGLWSFGNSFRGKTLLCLLLLINTGEKLGPLRYHICFR